MYGQDEVVPESHSCPVFRPVPRVPGVPDFRSIRISPASLVYRADRAGKCTPPGAAASPGSWQGSPWNLTGKVTSLLRSNIN